MIPIKRNLLYKGHAKVTEQFFFKIYITFLILNCEPMHIIFIIYVEIKCIQYSYKILNCVPTYLIGLMLE